MQSAKIVASCRSCSAVRLTRACRSPRQLRAPLRVSAATNFEAPELDSEALKSKVTETVTTTVSTLQKKWDETDDKPAVVTIAISSFVAIVALNAIADAINKIPLVSNLLELVGIAATTWFTYRYLVFGPDREELKSNILAFLQKVKGN